MRLLLRGRPGITLVEVLAAIFILGVGALAVLVLFPLGALKMAKSLQYSRCGTIANNADATAIMFDLRQDPAVVNAIKDGVAPAGSGYANSDPLGRGYPVFVDPYYAVQGYSKLGGSQIDRIAPAFANTQSKAERWFTLLDDDTYDAGGYPLLRRGFRYTWAYLLKRSRSATDDTNLYVIAYNGRPIQTPIGEEAYTVGSGTASRGGTSLVLQWAPGTQDRPALKRGGWLLDTTYTETARAGTTYGYINAEFYKVTDITEMADAGGVSQLQIDVQPPLRDGNIKQMVVLTSAVEVFDRGNGVR